ncbi:hypothetical protein [Thalassomonas sp. RHCl1]|uniref:hypothetical protein n=1 Tax=Thalassomonas sp. RHCl1 TaxID=2995320 RepID=UPI00248B654B|nr:hypothetical protein [Thalassomonas sp. RHCl1]
MAGYNDSAQGFIVAPMVFPSFVPAQTFLVIMPLPGDNSPKDDYPPCSLKQAFFSQFQRLFSWQYANKSFS